MDINGCVIESSVSVENEEGFSSTVTRDNVMRGPFKTIHEAIVAARDWDKTPLTPDAPFDVPVVTKVEVNAAFTHASDEVPQETEHQN